MSGNQQDFPAELLITKIAKGKPGFPLAASETILASADYLGK